MRIFKTLIIAAFAIATSAGMLLAADDPLEIHGGGRVGVTVNGKGGAWRNAMPGADNQMGEMPNYGTSNYMSLSFSKKVTAENGAWAKTSFAFDDWRQYVGGDLSVFNLRLRDFHEEFGGLDFLPAGAVLWGGLRGYGAGWDGMQDHQFINFAGIGFGIQNLGGVFSIAYMNQQAQSGTVNQASWSGGTYDSEQADLGYYVAHNVIASVNVPVADIYAAVGISKKAKGAGNKNLVNTFAGGIFHAPVLGLNIGAYFNTNAYAYENFANYSDTMLKGDHFSGANVDKTAKATGIAVAAWTVTDLAPGLYIAPAIRYDHVMVGKDNKMFYGGKAINKKNTIDKIQATFRISKSLTKNIAYCPTVGFGYWKDKEGALYQKDTVKGTKGANTVTQITPVAFEIGLDTGFWASQKLTFYGTYEMVGNKNQTQNLGAAYTNKKSGIFAGALVQFGF